VLEKVQSQFVVNLLYAWQDTTWVGLVLTLCAGGDLFFQIQQRYPLDKDGNKMKGAKYPGFPSNVLKFYTASIACGLQAIHKAGFVYRDLKPQNVLLDLNGQVRISDMGLAMDISKGPVVQTAGTRGYWAPEVIRKEPYQVQPDWFALGVTVYVLNCGKLPFRGRDAEEIDQRICETPIEYTHDEPAVLRALIEALCAKDRKGRLGCGGAGLEEIKKRSAYFAGFDWVSLEAGTMKAELIPDPNDINAPSAKDFAEFTSPKGVTWDAADQQKLNGWEYFGHKFWDAEAIRLIEKRKELVIGSGGRGAGCSCSIL